MYQYVLFDLDGTLTDPKVGICTCVQYALSKLGIEEPDINNLTPFIGPPLKDSFSEFYGMDDATIEKAIVFYRERFSTVGLFENELYEGIPELLKALCEKQVKVAVASSKPTVFVERILKHFHIDQYFAEVVGSELDGRRGKKEEVVEEALRRLGVDESKKAVCAMVGDRKFDIYGAKCFGLDSVGVRFGYAKPGELEEENPTFIAENVSELQKFLLKP